MPTPTVGPGGMIDATQDPYLITGGDVTASLQQLMIDMPKGTTILLKSGGYTVTSPCDFYTGVKNNDHVDSPRIMCEG